MRRTPYKWLDIVRLFQEHILLPNTELLEVRYYTAPVLGSLCDDPNPRNANGNTCKPYASCTQKNSPFLKASW